MKFVYFRTRECNITIKTFYASYACHDQNAKYLFNCDYPIVHIAMSNCNGWHANLSKITSKLHFTSLKYIHYKEKSVISQTVGILA